jgi:calmodulin
MYKRCVIDEKEREPKKLYHLIQFLMFDKEKKGYITEEDTLEVLCIRNTNGLDNAINDIFGIETKDENGKKNIKKRETLNYVEFADIMHNLNLKKRMQLMNKKKIFCDKIKAEAIQNAKNNNLQNQ